MRIAVLLIGLAAFLAKLLISMRTYGMNFGSLNSTLYDPPLVGYYLEAINTISPWGVPLRVTR